MPVATSLTTDLLKPALELLDKMYVKGVTYEKAGVIFSNLVPDSSLQSNFFAPSAQNEQRFLMSKIDNINFSMRNELVKFVSSGVVRPWKMKQEILSKRYTTRWNELREVS